MKAMRQWPCWAIHPPKDAPAITPAIWAVVKLATARDLHLGAVLLVVIEIAAGMNRASETPIAARIAKSMVAETDNPVAIVTKLQTIRLPMMSIFLE
jgi:hypothetical protein